MATTKITNPDLFDLASLDSALQLPSGTTAERPTSPSTGEWRYNTDNNLIEFYDGADWLTIQDEAIPPVPSENFNAVLYTGNGSTQSITGVGFQPDFVWIKDRTGSFGHRLIDSTTGADKYLESNSTSAQQGAGGAGLTSFDSDGFSLGSGNAHNANGNDFVAWCWKAGGTATDITSSSTGVSVASRTANSKAGFSVVNYTTNAADVIIPHGLSSTPQVALVKRTDSTSSWFFYNTVVSGSGRGILNTDAAFTNSGVPTFDSTNLTFQTNDPFNSGSSAVIYFFTEVAGYSKINTYTGTGSTTNRPIINTGFEPAFVMIKNTTTADDWMIHDNKRNPSNPRDRYIRANTNGQEGQFAEFGLDFLTNGFQVGPTTNNNWNGSGQTYIYIAFAADPSAAPVLTDSFNTNLYTGNGTSQSITGLGFSPSLVWIKQRDAVRSQNWYDILRGPNNIIFSNTTGAEDTSSTEVLQSFDTDGFTLGNLSAVNASGGQYVSWNWKANPLPAINTDGTIQSVVSANANSGFSIVKWTGTGSAGTVGHGLSAAPEIILTKRLSGVGDWYTFSVFANGGTTPANYFLKLNSTDAEILNTGSPPSVFAGTVPTATVFSVGTTLSGSSSDSYIAYCFASISGFSKIGTYTGNGSGNTQSINTGFAASWVMIKDYNVGGSWWIQDTNRGGSKSLKANLSDAESTTNYVTFTSTGFDVTGGLNDNASGSKFIYMAFKENPTPYPLAGNMSFLVVAGGGSGAMQHGGGGGAGGLRTSYGSTSGGGASAESDITLAAGTYTITVGSGANGVTPSPGNIAGLNGSDSSIAATGLTTITSIGGGGGSAYIGQTTPGNGGSGGGGGNQSQAGGSGTAGQGFAGGTGSSSSTNYPTGGGGGASAVGGNGSGSTAGDGGAGLSVSITGSSVAYAGGAGGSSFRGGTAGIGGIGGGANGTNSDGDGNAGTVNTGGGGGGATAPSGGTATSGNGGSGIVILRLLTSEYSSSTTGSPTVTTDGDYTVLTYTGSGTYVHS